MADPDEARVAGGDGALLSLALQVLLMPLKAFASTAPCDAAGVAALAGAPAEVVWTAFHLATLNAIDRLNKVVRELGIEPRPELFVDLEFVTPDWDMIAGRAVDEEDFARWREYAASHTSGIFTNDGSH